MNAIIGFTNLAATHLDDRELLQDYLNKITASSKHLLSLINDVLDMSRIESGKIVIAEAPGCLSQVLRDLQSIIQADLTSNQLHFHLDDSGMLHPYAFFDRLRLNQVLLNVLSNALKFTPAGGHISVFATERPGGSPDMSLYEFTIQDTGIGMDPEFLKHIFEPFERERTSTVSGIQGTGLGISITKNLVELMHGTITVESEKNQGSTFTLTFPLRLSQAPASQEAPAPPDEPQELAGWRLLLAEDNELNQEIAVTILEEAGCTVDVASDGAEAVEKVRRSVEQPYDLVLIVAMTANAFEEDRQKVLSAGMNGHLGKPIDVGVLFSTLQSILESPQA